VISPMNMPPGYFSLRQSPTPGGHVDTNQPENIEPSEIATALLAIGG
jgi:hypothetical protein